jgi:signal transduction histidine kinase
MDGLFESLIHELRGPLVPILGYASILNEEKLGSMTDRQKSAMGAIARNGTRLKELVEDMLDLERIDRGRHEFRMEILEWQPMIEELIPAWREAAEERSLSLDFTSAGGDCSIRGARTRLQRVADRLVRDAILSTQTGGRVVVKSAIRGPHAVAFWTRDGGFVDAAPDRPDTHARRVSTAVCRALLRAHGLELLVKSMPGGCRRSGFLIRGA